MQERMPLEQVAQDILRLPPLFGILKYLEYPGYFSVILGVWKVLGTVAVLALPLV
jgi:hypothetical protein